MREVAVYVWCLCMCASLFALGGYVFARMSFRLGFTVAFAAMLIGMFPFAFAAYIYKIDYVAVAGDGTPASKPFLVAMALPALPVIMSGIVAVGWWKTRTRKV